MPERVSVEVVYALPDEQLIFKVKLESGASIKKAIETCGVLTKYPEIDLSQNRVGIYSKKVTLDHPVQDGDRIEIYRPLPMDPKERRRLHIQNKRRINTES